MSTIVVTDSDTGVQAPAFNFHRCKRFLGREACVTGTLEVFRSRGQLMLRIVGAVTLDGTTLARAQRELPVAPACVRIPLGNIGALSVCVENVKLPRQFDVVIRAQVMGFSFEVYRRTIIIAKASSIEAIRGADGPTIDWVESLDDVTDGIIAVEVEDVTSDEADGDVSAEMAPNSGAPGLERYVVRGRLSGPSGGQIEAVIRRTS